MGYTTFRISTKELNDVYLPVKTGFDKMNESIISNGFGQIISNYNGPGDFTVNSYHVWDSAYNSMVVKTADDSMTYTEEQVGPSLWGVSSEVGISFLYGNTKISGLSIIKYCNNCEDRNGLPFQTIDSYSKRFQYIKQLNDDYKAETSYIFYDFTLPSNQRWFPAIYDSDSSDFIFKDYLGNIKDKTQVSTITSIPVLDIDTSLDESKPPIPSKCQEIILSYSTSRTDVCSTSQSSYSYDETNSLLYNSDSCDETFAPKGYYSDGESQYLWDGRKFSKGAICPPPSSYFNLVDISGDDANQSWTYTNSPVLQLWSEGPNTFRFIYDSTPLSLYIRISTSYDTPLQGQTSTIPPKYYGFSLVETYNTYTIGSGGYLTIGCNANSLRRTQTFPIEIQGNFGDKINPDWRAIGTFNATAVVV